MEFVSPITHQGKLHKKLNFDYGIKTGENYIYYENGQLKEVFITDAKGQKISSKKYYDSGKSRTNYYL